MQRAVGRAHKRLRGAHPRRPTSDFSNLMDVACDALLAAAGLVFLGGLALALRAVFGGFAAEDLILGFVLVGCSIILLCAWERLTWEPLAQRLDELS